jgi:hypothetical protein
MMLVLVRALMDSTPNIDDVFPHHGAFAACDGQPFLGEAEFDRPKDRPPYARGSSDSTGKANDKQKYPTSPD